MTLAEQKHAVNQAAFILLTVLVVLLLMQAADGVIKYLQVHESLQDLKKVNEQRGTQIAWDVLVAGETAIAARAVSLTPAGTMVTAEVTRDGLRISRTDAGGCTGSTRSGDCSQGSGAKCGRLTDWVGGWIASFARPLHAERTVLDPQPGNRM